MAGLPTRTLGRTGLEVRSLGFGSGELRGPAYGGPAVSDHDASVLLNAVLDAGMNFIDTAPDYGASEEHIGRAIAHRRSEFFLASKVGCPVGAPPPSPGIAQEHVLPPHVFTAHNVRAGVEQSLRRMKTEYLDLVQFHLTPSRQKLEEHGALEELLKLRTEGTVRFVGMSGTLPHLPEHISMGVFDAFQIPYSALQREHEALISQAAAAGAGVVIRGGAARGTPTDWESRSITMLAMRGVNVRDRWEQAQLDELLDGMSRMEFTLRFTLSHPHLHTAIVGTRDPAHLRDNIAAAAKGPLPENLVVQAKRRLDAAGSRSS